MIPTQQVDLPNDPKRLQILQKGKLRVEVYDGLINDNEFICSFIQNTPLLAAGTARVVWTDNDLIIYERDDPKNRNAFSFNAKGVLSDPNESPVRLRANYHLTWDGQDWPARKEVFNIRLN